MATKIEYLYEKQDLYDIFQTPEDEIGTDFDEPLLKIIHDVSNPVFLLLGYDEKKNLYYFTFEDNEVSEDFYCHNGDLTSMFNEIMQGKGEYEIWVKG